jgi:mercuric ion transport protein
MEKNKEEVFLSVEEKPARKGLLSLGLVGAIISGFLASACCIGPLLVVFLGIGGAGALMQFEPYRWYFTVIMFLFIGYGFYLTYRKPKVVGGEACCTVGSKKKQKIALWVATVVALGLLVAPNLLVLFLG